MDSNLELRIRKYQANRLEAITSVGHVRPAPQSYSGFEAYWRERDASKLTRNAVEQSLIDEVWLYPLNFIDDFESGGHDAPLKHFFYEIYIFTQYGAMRKDETDDADIFDKKVLYQHNLHTAKWLDIIDEYQREIDIPDGVILLGDEDYVTAKTVPVVQVEDTQHNVECDFIEGLVGYSTRLISAVLLEKAAC